jgi:putative Ca2+/H+ antiporter (TMEM165/GDT1 family)
MHDLGTALFFVFVAEMGDKTQLMTLALAARYKSLPVLLGVCLAAMLINSISVLLGCSVGKVLPQFWLNICAGVAFIIFGALALRADKKDEREEEEAPKLDRYGVILAVALSFFLAELGDKTMLTTAALASRTNNVLQVWLGSTVGLVLANALAIVLGASMASRLSGRLTQAIVAAIFAVSGLIVIAQAFLTR